MYEVVYMHKLGFIEFLKTTQTQIFMNNFTGLWNACVMDNANVVLSARVQILGAVNTVVAACKLGQTVSSRWHRCKLMLYAEDKSIVDNYDSKRNNIMYFLQNERDVDS